jgi:hypothetical protein
MFWNHGDAFAKGNLLEPGPKEVRNPNIAENVVSKFSGKPLSWLVLCRENKRLFFSVRY